MTSVNGQYIYNFVNFRYNFSIKVHSFSKLRSTMICQLHDGTKALNELFKPRLLQVFL